MIERVVTPTHVCLLLSDYDGCLEMNMNNHKQLLVTRLEEEMLDVAKQYVCPNIISRSIGIPSGVNLPIFWEPIGD